MQSHFNGLINCGSTDTACWNSLSLDTILDAQGELCNDSMSIDPSTGLSQPIRVVRDGQFITSPLDSTAPFPSVNKPILVTSVLHEAGFAIYQSFPTPIPQDWLYPVCNATFGSRTDVIIDSPYYPAASGSTDPRPQLQTMGTDYLWKCSGWTFARNWVQHGGSAFVAEYSIGASYPGNEEVPFCTEPGKVCHQDDIMIVVSRRFFHRRFGYKTDAALHSLVRLLTQHRHRVLLSPRCRSITRLSSTTETLTPQGSRPGLLRHPLTSTPSDSVARAKSQLALATPHSGAKLLNTIIKFTISRFRCNA